MDREDGRRSSAEQTAATRAGETETGRVVQQQSISSSNTAGRARLEGSPASQKVERQGVGGCPASQQAERSCILKDAPCLFTCARTHPDSQKRGNMQLHITS